MKKLFFVFFVILILSFYITFDIKKSDIDYTNTKNSKITDNLYLVRPEEGMLYKGQENGRWDRGKTSNIISSSRVIGQGFWAFNSSAQWMPHPDRVVMIELAKGARRQGLTPFSY